MQTQCEKPHSPTSRRTFLTSAAGAMSLSIALPKLASAAPALKPIKLAIVTDTHLGYQKKDSAEKLWTRTAAEIAGSDAQFVLHLGDIVDGGQESMYPKYVEGRRQIGVPVHEIPGNHDPHDLFEKHIRTPIDIVVTHDWLKILLVGNAQRDSHDGFLTEKQLAWMDEQLKETAKQDRFAVLAMHVPAHANKHPDRGWYVKPESGQKGLYALLDKHKSRVLALIHGHFHNGLRGWDDHVPLHEICFPSALYNQDRKLTAQQAPGYNLPEFRSCYSLIKLDGGTMHIELRIVGAESGITKELKLDVG